MKKDYTHVAMVIDRSGSMSSSWNDVKGGYAQFINDQKSQPGKCTFTLTVFDHEIDSLEDFTDIQSVSPNLSVSPRGSTALLDAIGRTVVKVGESLAKMDENERPEKVLVIIQTDGFENASLEFTNQSVKDLIKEQEDKYKWEFSFIGASLQSVAQAQTFGFKAANSAFYNQSNSKNLMANVSMKTSAYRSAGAGAASFDFTEDERESLAKEA